MGKRRERRSRVGKMIVVSDLIALEERNGLVTWVCERGVLRPISLVMGPPVLIKGVAMAQRLVAQGDIVPFAPQRHH